MQIYSYFAGIPTKILLHLIYQLILVQLPDHIWYLCPKSPPLFGVEYYLKSNRTFNKKTTHQSPADSAGFFSCRISRPRYQANHLGFCPPSLCNASTSPQSRAWQYLELLGHRSNETMKALGKRLEKLEDVCFWVFFLTSNVTCGCFWFVCFLFVFFWNIDINYQYLVFKIGSFLLFFFGKLGGGYSDTLGGWSLIRFENVCCKKSGKAAGEWTSTVPSEKKSSFIVH